MVLVPVFFAMSFFLLAVFALDTWRSWPVLIIATGFIACMLLVTCVLFAQSRRCKADKSRRITSMPLHELGQSSAHHSRKGKNNDASRNGLPMR